jgi:hypothetical protein
MKDICENLKPGSGKIWKNSITIPTVPNITGINPDLDDLSQPQIIQQSKQSQQKPVIKSLARPITPGNSSHMNTLKRHKMYKTKSML